jgi:hypothetical protein
MSDLTKDQRALLEWLGREDFSQYGECHGRSLDALIDAGLVQVHSDGSGQSGFIAKGDAMMFCAVSLTEAGKDALRRMREDKP